MALCEAGAALDDSRQRDERSDRGLFWKDAARPAPLAECRDAALYIDVLAPKQLDRRVVAIKGGWDTAVLPELYRLAEQHGPPNGPGDWRLARKRFGGATMTLWSAQLTEKDPAEATEVALVAKDWIDTVAPS